MPTEGSSLADCSEIIIWLPKDVGVITFDKVLLQWLNNRGTLQTKEFKAEDVPFVYDESYKGYVSHIPLAGVSKDREVTLTVEGGMLSNGDSIEITGKFNTDPTGIDSVLVTMPMPLLSFTQSTVSSLRRLLLQLFLQVLRRAFIS